MVNIRKQKAKLVEKDISIIELANALGIDKSTVYRKINQSRENFTVKDVEKISNVLSLTYDDINDIFLLMQSHSVRRIRRGEIKRKERSTVSRTL